MSNSNGWALTARLITKHFGALGDRVSEAIANFDPETATEADRDRLSLWSAQGPCVVLANPLAMG
eukprot:gene33974-38398_t